MSQKHVVLIAGPTAVGKSDVAIAVAEHLNTAIISADSRQCFQEMCIGTAVPNLKDLERVPHYFIQTHSIHDEMSAGVFERYALNVLDHLFQHHDQVVVCGGTGLYIQALLYGMDDMPKVDKSIEAEINKQYAQGGIEYLIEALKITDTLFVEQGEMQNPARMLRALIFYSSTGQSILTYQNRQKKTRPFSVIKVGLELPREELYARINKRVELMDEMGLESELERLYDYRNEKNMLTVGYQEFYDWGHWPLSRDEYKSSIEKVKQHSRQYAKRQLTWFKNREQFQWFHPQDVSGVIKYIHKDIKSKQ